MRPLADHFAHEWNIAPALQGKGSKAVPVVLLLAPAKLEGVRVSDGFCRLRAAGGLPGAGPPDGCWPRLLDRSRRWWGVAGRSPPHEKIRAGTIVLRGKGRVGEFLPSMIICMVWGMGGGSKMLLRFGWGGFMANTEGQWGLQALNPLWISNDISGIKKRCTCSSC